MLSFLADIICTITEAEKPSGYDKDVEIKEDVWIGMNVTLLSVVTICIGAILSAGSVVSKDIPPCCIAGDVSAKPIKFKWSIDHIILHESKLIQKIKGICVSN